MNNLRIMNLRRVLSLLVIIALFNACDIFKEDPEEDPPSEAVGTILWSYEDFHQVPIQQGSVGIGTPAIGMDGSIYVTSYGNSATWIPGRIHAINRDSTHKWTTEETDFIGPSDPAVAADGTVYAIGYTTVYSINPADGTFNWTFQPNADSNERHQLSWLTMGNNGMIFFAHIESGVYARRIYALNSSGQIVWKKKVEWGASHLMVGRDGTLFAYWAVGSDNTIFALDPGTGAVKWSSVIGGSLQGGNGGAVNQDGHLILSQSNPDKLVKLNGNNGDPMFVVDCKKGFPSVSPDGQIYIADNDLYCYNDSGALLWQSGTSSTGGKVAIDAQGNAYLSASDNGQGNFQVYEHDGTLRWTTYQNMTHTRAVAIGSNNVIYISFSRLLGGSSVLYAVQGDNPLSLLGWPRDTGGNKNSKNLGIR